jgi:hypothetical protein
MGSCRRQGSSCIRGCPSWRRWRCRDGRWSFYRRINQDCRDCRFIQVSSRQTSKQCRPYTPNQSTTYRYGYKGTGSQSQPTPKSRSARTKQVGKGFRVRSTCTHYETEMDVGWKEKGWKDRPKIVSFSSFAFWCISFSYSLYDVYGFVCILCALHIQPKIERHPHLICLHRPKIKLVPLAAHIRCMRYLTSPIDDAPHFGRRT